MALSKITNESLAANTVDSDKIAADAIGTTELANNVAISTSGAVTTTGAFTSPGIDDNGDATTITIDANEHVGIGTASPSVQLHIDESASNSYGTMRLEGNNRGGDIEMYQGTVPVSTIRTDQSGNMYFKTSGAYGSSSLTNKLIIATAGNVGIGTDSPADKLHVKGGQIQVESLAGDAAYLRIDNDVNSGGKIWRVGDGVSAHGTFSIYNQTDNTFPFNISLDGVSGGSATNGVARYRNHTSLTLGYGSTVQFTVGQGLINVSNRSYGYGALFMVSYASQVAEVSDPSNQFDVGSGGNILGAGVYKSTNNYTAYVINKDTNGGTRGFSIQVISNDF